MYKTFSNSLRKSIKWNNDLKDILNERKIENKYGRTEKDICALKRCR